MTASSDRPTIRLGLPKGRMQEEVVRLLADAGIRLAHGPREYRPRISLDGFEVKFLKPQNMVEMLQEGSRDIGFAGADWVAELDLELVELLDTGLNPIRLVAATTDAYLERKSSEPFVVATEFANLTRAWLADNKLEGRILRAYGATEVFPPEDADYIVDVTATGATLEANNLVITDELMTSSTRLYANPRVLDDPAIDAVTIATPNHWHCAIAVRALQAGKDEKGLLARALQEIDWRRRRRGSHPHADEEREGRADRGGRHSL